MTISNKDGREVTRQDSGGLLLSLLVGGAISVVALFLDLVVDFEYPSFPGLVLDMLLSGLLSNPHGGFRSAFLDDLVTFLGNFAFYSILVFCVISIAKRVGKRNS